METGVDTGDRKTQRREEVRARLRAALENLAAGRTFRDITVVEITSAAGLSRSSFYFYYEDKRDLLIEAVSRISKSTFEITSDRFNQEGDSRGLIREVLRDNAEAWKCNADLLRCVIEASVYDETVQSFWGGVVVDFTATVSERLRTDQDQGLIPEALDVATCADILMTATVGFLYHRISEGETTPEQAVTALEPIWTRVLYA